MSYEEAMDRYGTDRPDTRFGLEIVDICEELRGSEFKVFEGVLDAGGVVRAINAGAREMSRSEIEGLNEVVQRHGGKAVAWAVVEAGGTSCSPIAKFFEQIAAATRALEASEGIKWFYQCIQSRYGFNPHHLRLADACEFFIGQGCKVGLGGHLMGQKVTDQVAEMRSLPAGIDQRSPARHPDWLGPDDLALKIEEVREATNWEIPIQLKLGAARVYDDVRMAVKCGPDSIYIDGMEGGTGAGPHVATEDTGVPGIAAIRQARRAIDELGKRGEISARLCRRHQERRRRGQGAGARRRCGGDRPFGADGAELQQGNSGVRFRERDRRARRVLLSLPYRPLPGRRRHARPGTAKAARSRRGSGARL